MFKEKEFDPTVCFSFFSDWLDVIEATETETDRKSESYMLFKAIANYGLYGKEPDFDKSDANKSFKRFWPILERQIDKSVSNRKRGFSHSNGPTENARKVIDAYRKKPGASIRDVSDITGVSKSEVGRIKRKYLNTDRTPPISTSVPSSNPNPDTSPSAGHGTGRDTGQRATREKTHISFLDKMLDFLYEKYSYGVGTVEFSEEGEAVVDLKPAFFYIPPDAVKSKGRDVYRECPACVRDGWDSLADDNENMPF